MIDSTCAGTRREARGRSCSIPWTTGGGAERQTQSGGLSTLVLDWRRHNICRVPQVDQTCSARLRSSACQELPSSPQSRRDELTRTKIPTKIHCFSRLSPTKMSHNPRLLSWTNHCWNPNRDRWNGHQCCSQCTTQSGPTKEFFS